MEWVNRSTRKWEERTARLAVWHRWFAWYPVTIKSHSDGTETRAWLQWVLKRQTRTYDENAGYTFEDTEYKKIEGKGARE